jgi:hypothetical protein
MARAAAAREKGRMTHRFPITLLTIALSLPLSACATTQQVARDDGNARLGEATRAGPLTVRPIKVVEDSRCPINARCVWAGRLIVRASIAEGSHRVTRDLTLADPLLIAGGHLTLDGSEPGKIAGQNQDPLDFTYHFSFSS